MLGGPGTRAAAHPGMVFRLQYRDTSALVHAYETEGAALAFLRDVVRVGGWERAGQFTLVRVDANGETTVLARGEDLVTRALQDLAP